MLPLNLFLILCMILFRSRNFSRTWVLHQHNDCQASLGLITPKGPSRALIFPIFIVIIKDPTGCKVIVKPQDIESIQVVELFLLFWFFLIKNFLYEYCIEIIFPSFSTFSNPFHVPLLVHNWNIREMVAIPAGVGCKMVLCVVLKFSDFYPCLCLQISMCPSRFGMMSLPTLLEQMWLGL